MSSLWLLLTPELKQFPRAQQVQALRDARACELESGELIVMAIWLVLVTSLTKMFMVEVSMGNDITATLMVNILVVAPLLLLGFMPIHIRRLRRGLRKQLHARGML